MRKALISSWNFCFCKFLKHHNYWTPWERPQKLMTFNRRFSVTETRYRALQERSYECNQFLLQVVELFLRWTYPKKMSKHVLIKFSKLNHYLSWSNSYRKLICQILKAEPLRSIGAIILGRNMITWWWLLSRKAFIYFLWQRWDRNPSNVEQKCISLVGRWKNGALWGTISLFCKPFAGNVITQFI